MQRKNKCHWSLGYWSSRKQGNDQGQGQNVHVCPLSILQVCTFCQTDIHTLFLLLFFYVIGGDTLASFPVLLHLRFTIPCNTQTWKEESYHHTNHVTNLLFQTTAHGHFYYLIPLLISWQCPHKPVSSDLILPFCLMVWCVKLLIASMQVCDSSDEEDSEGASERHLHQATRGREGEEGQLCAGCKCIMQ